MPDTTLTIGRANSALEASDGRGGEKPGSSPATPPGTPATGGRWAVGLLSVVGTLALVFLLSPGLRSDLGGLLALLGNIGVAGIRDWILSFGALSPVVYFFIVVGQVILSPIPAGPVTLAGALSRWPCW